MLYLILLIKDTGSSGIEYEGEVVVERREAPRRRWVVRPTSEFLRPTKSSPTTLFVLGLQVHIA